MSLVTGLTVFCSNRFIYNIHAHYTDDTAMSIYNNLGLSKQETVLWVYFPFAAGELITKAWVYDNSHFVTGSILRVSISDITPLDIQF